MHLHISLGSIKHGHCISFTAHLPRGQMDVIPRPLNLQLNNEISKRMETKHGASFIAQEINTIAEQEVVDQAEQKLSAVS